MRQNYMPNDQYPQGTAEVAPKPKRKIGRWVLLGVLAVSLLGFMIIVGSAMTSLGKQTAQVAESQGTAGQAGAEGLGSASVAATFTTADYKIGSVNDAEAKTLKAGTLTIEARKGPCYWARVKTWDGELASTITNGNLDEGQTKIVTVKKTDAGLHLEGFCFLRVK